MVRKNLLDKLLGIGNDVTLNIIKSLEPIFGFYTDVYHPLSETPDSVYGSDDNKWLYPKEPSEKARYIVLNLFEDDFSLGDVTYDPFPSTQVYILTHGKRMIPSNSKVVIYKGDSHYKGRVVTHKVLNGRNGPIYIKNIVAPWS